VGQSAGAGSIVTLLSMPLAAGLFQRSGLAERPRERLYRVPIANTHHPCGDLLFLGTVIRT
jgi:hypothetical protein